MKVILCVRCPVCGGSGAVEPSFGSGCVYSPGQSITAATSSKMCPACNGMGYQQCEADC